MLDVDLDGRCGCSSSIDALHRERQNSESDGIDVKHVAECVVSADADLTAKMM